MNDVNPPCNQLDEHDFNDWLRLKIEVVNLRGLHARAAVKLAQTLSDYDAEIKITKDNCEFVDAKSVMGMMMLGAAKGTMLMIKAKGTDAEQALYELKLLVNNRFGEDE